MTQVQQVLDERQSTYGDFTSVAVITETIMQVLSGNKTQRSADMNMALYMIASKLARIANGDPTHKDSWVDIAGYAQLVVDRLDNEKLPF